MRTVVHVSDLHFGRADMAVIDSLLASWRELKPDLIIISGDITQRAKAEEFAEARRFLQKLDREKLPYFVIPGNHDIAPIYRPLGRLLTAYKHYRAYISERTETFYHDGEIAVASINTVKRSHPVNGRVARAQITEVRDWFAQFPGAVKIVVTHHPLQRNNNRRNRIACWGGDTAVRALESSEVDLYLCGHHHRSSVSSTRSIEVHAGTVSERLKGEQPSFNVLSIDAPRFTVSTFHWDPSLKRFARTTSKDLLHDKKLLPPATAKPSPLKKLRAKLRARR